MLRRKLAACLGVFLLWSPAWCDSVISSSSLTLADDYGTWTYNLWQNAKGERYLEITAFEYKEPSTDIVVPAELPVTGISPGVVEVDGKEIYVGLLSETNKVLIVGGLNSPQLTSVRLPEGVTNLSARAFENATSLTNAVLPSTLTGIGTAAFSHCVSLKAASIPEGVATLPDAYFSGCSHLSSVSLPDSLRSIGERAFDSCSALETVAIPEGVTAIPTSCFNLCTGLKSVSLPSTLLALCDGAFGGCTALQEIAVPEGVARIGTGCFSSCTALSVLTLPSTLLTLSDAAFSNCSALVEIQLPIHLETIGDAAFCGCAELGALQIPASVTTLSDRFRDCPSLAAIAVAAENTVYASAGGALYDKALSRLYRCPAQLTSLTLPATVTAIEAAAFADCTELKTVSIPEGVATIPERAFDGARQIESITLPSTLATIGQYAFRNCAALKKLTVPEGVKTIPSHCFTGCASLQTVTLPATLTSISSQGFDSCGIRYIAIPQGVTALATGTFAHCTNLVTVALPQNLETLSDLVFDDCTQLRNVTIPASLVTLSAKAFGEGNTTLEKIAFRGAPNSNWIKGLQALCNGQQAKVFCTRAYGAAWLKQLKNQYIGGFMDADRDFPSVSILSIGMRKTDPSVLDVTYVVTSRNDRVDVRMLAFLGGTRDCAHLIRPETFVDGTGVNLSDGVAANVPQTVSWRVTADCSSNVPPFAVDILAREVGELLPLELERIPATSSHRGVLFSWNAVTAQQYFDAILWLYASRESGLTLKDGGLYFNGTILATKATDCNKPAAEYVLDKMGYSPMTTDDVKYVNGLMESTLTKIELLSPNGVTQYAVRYFDFTP